MIGLYLDTKNIWLCSGKDHVLVATNTPQVIQRLCSKQPVLLPQTRLEMPQLHQNLQFVFLPQPPLEIVSTSPLNDPVVSHLTMLKKLWSLAWQPSHL